MPERVEARYNAVFRRGWTVFLAAWVVVGGVMFVTGMVAMLPPPGGAMPLLLSGTASVVGHASQHVGELLAQINETFANFDALLAEARRHQPSLPAGFGTGTRLKVYVRDADDLPLVAQALDERFGATVPRLLLHAVICRRELAVEIDGVHV